MSGLLGVSSVKAGVVLRSRGGMGQTYLVVEAKDSGKFRLMSVEACTLVTSKMTADQLVLFARRWDIVMHQLPFRDLLRP